MSEQRQPQTAAPCGLPRRRLFRIIVPAFPAFNVYSRIARITTALGPVSVATVAHKTPGWDAEVIDENNYRAPGPRTSDGLPDHEALQADRPADVVGFYGGLTSTIPRVYRLAAFYRQRGVLTVAGGQHFVDENIREGLQHGLDYLILGEGEATVYEWLQAVRDGQPMDTIPGLAFLRDGQLIQTEDRPPITDFSVLPMPDFSLVRYARLRVYPVSWVRGCGMNCEFCTVKGEVRCPPPEYVYRQITHLVEERGARHFFIVDDLFAQQRSAALRLCTMLQAYQQRTRLRLDLTVQIRLDKGRDTELLTAMRRAGINTVAIGFESPIPEELSAMRKKTRPEDMIELSRAYHRAGFLVHGMFIFGYPISGRVSVPIPVEERVRRFRTFIRRAQIDTVQVLLAVPAPGTEMTRRLEKEGRIFPRKIVGWEYYDGNFPVFEPDPPLTAEDMQAAVRHILGRFYQFRQALLVVVSVLIFPWLVFSLHHLRRAWQEWYRHWRNHRIRFGGWLILRRWTEDLKRGEFLKRLSEAQRFLQSRKGHTSQEVYS